MALETIIEKIPGINMLPPPWDAVALLGGAGLGTFFGYKWAKGRGYLGEVEVYGPSYAGFGRRGGRSAQQKRFGAAARKCRGRSQRDFRACMSSALGGTGLSGTPKRKTKKRKTTKRKATSKRKAAPKRKSAGRKGASRAQIAQRNRMKRASKSCKGKKGNARKSCMRKALKK